MKQAFFLLCCCIAFSLSAVKPTVSIKAKRVRLKRYMSLREKVFRQPVIRSLKREIQKHERRQRSVQEHETRLQEHDSSESDTSSSIDTEYERKHGYGPIIYKALYPNSEDSCGE